MSTRANIIITDGYSNQIFYRHSDGYPEGVRKTLQQFIDWVAEGKIRNNVSQAAGWLIMLGALEYQTIPKIKKGTKKYDLDLGDGLMDWKVGAYEPTDQVHGDIEYLYLIDLRKPSVKLIKDWSNANIDRLDIKLENAILDKILDSVAGLLNPEFVKTAKGKVIFKPAPKVLELEEPTTITLAKGGNAIIIKKS